MRLKDARKFQKDTDESAKAVSRFDKNVKQTGRTADTTTSKFGKMRKSLAGFGPAAAAGFAAAGYAAFQFGKTGVTQAVDVGEALNVLDVVVGKNAKGFEAWSKG